MYQILLITPDGQDYKLDCKRSSTPELAWERCDNLGSKWIFYPICFVIRDNAYLNIEHQFIIDSPNLLQHLTGGTVKQAIDYITENSEELIAAIS